MKEFDVIVIGAGPGGYECASLLGTKGLSLALVEKDEKLIGGTCLTQGCIPAKHYLESAAYVSKQHYFANNGVLSNGISMNMEELKNSKAKLIEQLQNGIKAKLKKTKVHTIFGSASFIDAHTISVDGEHYSAKNFVIATGSKHRPHPLLQIDGKKILSSQEIFELETLPNSLLVVGGGAIGCEFATFFNSLGVQVHISEFTENIIPTEDVDVAKTLKREMEKKGIKITQSANVIAYEAIDNGVKISMDTPKGLHEESYDMVLVSIGRSPNTDSLGLKNIDLQTQRGFVNVNENLQTDHSHIYAIGDVIPTWALAHSAYNEAGVVAHNIANEQKQSPATVTPSVIFSTPQVASVGQNEKQLKDNKTPYTVKKHFFKSSGKAKIKGDDSGFIKLLVGEDDIILGAAIIGNDATELIHELLIAVNMKLTCKDLSKMVFAHPTLSESLWEMVK